ncbi:hypothetical protein GQ42DRAFT_19131 [Ramicandelaber brevisporus]|nr:hypothetical protein GQ42DRAFT_19131 [Ramicandelaber brevisporus]
MIWMLQPVSARRVDDTDTVEVKCSVTTTARSVSHSLVRLLYLDLPSFMSSFILYSFRRHRLLYKNIVNRCCCSCRSHHRSPLSLARLFVDLFEVDGGCRLVLNLGSERVCVVVTQWKGDQTCSTLREFGKVELLNLRFHLVLDI